MLDNALDYGLSEQDFWNMTLAELDRYVESQKRIMKYKAQEKATYDYILATTIGLAVGRSFSGSDKDFPEIHEIYPSLFDGQEREEQKQSRRDDLSALRFKQFAKSYNKKYEEVANDK